MRDQLAINAKIRQKALERKANGTLKLPPPFVKGFDPRRGIPSANDRLRGGLTRKKQLLDQWHEKIKKIEVDEPVNFFQLKRYLLEKSDVCSRCNNNTWLNEPLMLELHHIDGNSKNHRLSNGKILCPNCHSQTDNFRNKKRIMAI